MRFFISLLFRKYNYTNSTSFINEVRSNPIPRHERMGTIDLMRSIQENERIEILTINFYDYRFKEEFKDA